MATSVAAEEQFPIAAHVNVRPPASYQHLLDVQHVFSVGQVPVYEFVVHCAPVPLELPLPVELPLPLELPLPPLHADELDPHVPSPQQTPDEQ